LLRVQNEQVAALHMQVAAQQIAADRQAELLELQRQQLDDQRKATAGQAEVLELQATELRESLEERKREAERRHRAQAARVFIEEETHDRNPQGRPATDVDPPSVTVIVRITSDQPVYSAELRWHRGTAGYGEPNPEPIGTVMPGRGHHRGAGLPCRYQHGRERGRRHVH
jgi:hypothetical protein